MNRIKASRFGATQKLGFIVVDHSLGTRTGDLHVGKILGQSAGAHGALIPAKRSDSVRRSSSEAEAFHVRQATNSLHPAHAAERH